MQYIYFDQFKPCAQTLYRLTGFGHYITDKVKTGTGEAATVASHVRLSVTQNFLPLTIPLAETLRECMLEYAGHYVSNVIARLLAKSGRIDAEVIDHLYPWDKLMFLWRDEGMSVERLEELLAGANLSKQFTEADRKKLTSWIAEPLTAIKEEEEVFTTVFGHCAVMALLDTSDSNPEIASLFATLLNHLELPDRIEEADQFQEDHHEEYVPIELGGGAATADEEYGVGSVVVRFLHKNTTYEFLFCHDWQDLDMDLLTANFNAFMERIGHTERAFRIKVQEDYSREIAWFIVAEPSSFIELTERLHVPVADRGVGLTPSLKVSTRWRYPERNSSP